MTRAPQAGADGAPRGGASARSERGTTFVELMGAITIVSLATLLMLHQLTISYREGTVQHEQLWAHDKGTQILSELQSGVERGTIPDAEALQALADAGYNPVLTTVTDEAGVPLPPDHPMSGNWQRFGRWVWARQITVTSPPGQDRIRYVNLRLAKYSDHGIPQVVTPMSTVVTLPRRTYPSTTVYDLYVLALAEVPSPLGPLPALRSSLEATLRRVASDAPSVEFRVHWITRLGYGRDLLYAPYFNDTVLAAAADPRVFWYPERLDTGTWLFSNGYHTGRHRTDAGIVKDYDPDSCPVPHAIADQFNHCLRLPAALALFQQRLAAGLENEAEPPLQILLADLVANPDRYRNAIVLNLHGDGIPFPPVRNYADAAAAAEIVPSARVVTHAAHLVTPRDVNGDGNNADSQDLELRVYAYKQVPSVGPALLPQPITVQIFGGDFRSHLSVRRLPGGIDTASGSASALAPYGAFDGVLGEPPTSDPGELAMWCETGYAAAPSPHTWIRLHNTPLCCPPALGSGLDAGARLYGLEYVPTPLGTTPFARDLASIGLQPKNTARWRIRIGRTALGTILSNADQCVTVTTRIGTDLTTGTLWPTANQPRNRSTTYAWWARDAAVVPPLERYQFLGDPRHNPYADVAAAGGYNCCFAGSGIPLRAADWDAIQPLRLRELGFGDGLTCDVPRALSVWRAALQHAGLVFVNLGPLAGRFYIGGEICGPATARGTQLGKVALPGALFGGAGTVLVDTVTPETIAAIEAPLEEGPAVPTVLLGEHLVRGPGAFWAKPWLGDLVADADYPEWFTTGNLIAGSRYRRELRSQSVPPGLPAGAVFLGVPAGATIGTLGGTAFAQSGTPAATFAHQYLADGTAAVTADGRVVPKLLGFAWSPIQSAVQPFSLSLLGNPTAPHFLLPAEFPVQTLQLLESHFASSGNGHSAGALLRLADPAGAAAFLELVSLSPNSAPEIESLLDLGVGESVRALQAAGNPAISGRIEQIGRVEIVDPAKGSLAENPQALTVTWQVDFMGFDGQLPTASYPVGFTEDEGGLCYALLCSRDGGTSWFHGLSGSPARPGERPDPSLLIPDAGTGNESISLPTPASAFPAGELLLRVEAYHQTRLSHYGHHSVVVVVKR